MGQLNSCLKPQVNEALEKQHKRSKDSIPAAAAASPAAVFVSTDTATSSPANSAKQDAPVTADHADATAAAAAPVASSAVSNNNSSSAAGVDCLPGKFDPYVTPPGGLGTPVQPGMPHNPHFAGPPRPPCEDERLEVAEQISELLDTAPKKELENILQLVCSIFGVSNALIALFGDRRIYILNTIGGFKAGDFPWRWSFCGWTMASEQHSVMVINDALQDARFHDNKYVQDIGVRFYCGAPLVSSSGHRLGTLCFADTEPRVFDTSSLQILVNFSELVTRELEKDIALAKQQLAQNANAKAERAQQYKLLLRTLDCVTSAVLLVDTSKPDWPVVHANSGWQRLLQQCSNGSSSRSMVSSSSRSGHRNGFSSRHEGEFGSTISCNTALSEQGSTGSTAAAGSTDDTAAAAGGTCSTKPDPLASFCCGVPLDQLHPISESEDAAAAAVGSDTKSQLTAGNLAQSNTMPEIVGKSLWSLVDTHMLQQLGNSSSNSDSSSSGGGGGVWGGWSPGSQVVEQVKGRQSFTLRGVKMSGNLGGASAQLSFRCAGFSTLEGAVNVCLPAFAPDRSELTAAADELSAHSPVPVKPSVATGGESLYFVTIKLHTPPRSSGSSSNSSGMTCSSLSSSMWTSNSNINSNQSLGFSPGSSSLQNPKGVTMHPGQVFTTTRLSVDSCMYPQFDNLDVVPGFSNEQLSTGSLNPNTAGLVVISSVPEKPDSSSSRVGSMDLQNRAATLSSSSCTDAGGDLHSSSSSSSSFTGSLSSVCAGLVCKRIAGLALGGQIAAGSYGRVFRGEYFGSKVAVKVLDGHAVLRRDEATGFCLEAVMSEQLKHPNIVRTLAWAVVTGEGKMPAKSNLWGETLNPDRPTVAQNAAMVAAAGGGGGGGGGNKTHQQQQPQQQQQHKEASHYDKLMQLGTPNHLGSGGENNSGNDTVSNTSNAEHDSLTAELLEGFEHEPEDITAGQTWMVLEYCDKGCLQDAVERGWLREARSCVSGPINLLAVLATAAEIASGMALLHSQGIIHGDLSAFNVMLSSADATASIGGRGFVAKVADFGLSRMLTHGSKVVTKTYGTITHMPPETLEHGLASKAADVYSFGVLLWQMVTGSRAWAGMSHMAVVNAVCGQQLQLEFPSDAPEALVMLGRACMSYSPANRPSFEDILEILEPLNSVITGKHSSSDSASHGQLLRPSNSSSGVVAAAAAGGGGDARGVDSL